LVFFDKTTAQADAGIGLLLGRQRERYTSEYQILRGDIPYDHSTQTLDAAWRSSEVETQRILRGEFLQKLGPESDGVIFFSSG
jgi:hypothetical protein